MGTSASHPGSGSNSPLIPPWADPANPLPSPPAPPRRFRDFRTALGRFAATGNEGNLRNALKHFATTAVGGAATGARRFTSMMGAGADAFTAFAGTGNIGAALARAGVDLAALRGADLNTVIEAIARAFAPDNADHDKVEEALRAALFVVLEDVDDFDVETFQGFDEDTYVNLVAVFIENCVLEHLLSEGGPAWDRAGTPQEQQNREDQLRLLISAEVSGQLEAHSANGITNMTRDQLLRTQVSVIEGVLRGWETYSE
jgi:hypothetical protein